VSLTAPTQSPSVPPLDKRSAPEDVWVEESVLKASVLVTLDSRVLIVLSMLR